MHGANLSLGWRANDLPHNRFGFVVGKRVGKAVTRNLIKRRLRAIAPTLPARTGFDLVISAKSGATRRTFAELAEEMGQLIRRAKLTQPPPTSIVATSDPEGGSS